MIYYQGVKDVYMHPLSIILGPPWEIFNSQVIPFYWPPGKLHEVGLQLLTCTCICRLKSKYLAIPYTTSGTMK